MANFKGFKQVSLATYNATSEQERKNYLWFVREMSGETVISSSIYFGNRKYADVNDDAMEITKLNNLITSMGSFIDENGEFVGFLPFDEHALLGDSGITSVSDALSVLEAAILENTDTIAGKVSQDEYDAKVAELEGAINEKVNTSDYEAKVAELEDKIDTMSQETISAITEDINEIKDELPTKAGKDELTAVDGKVDALSAETASFESEMNQALSSLTEIVDTKADAADVYTKNEVYTKDEVDAKVAGAFHFKGDAEAISADETVITVNGEEIAASEENAGDVYQIGDVEYASNGEKWVKLGFNIDLSDYATKDYVDTAITNEAAAREALADEVELVKSGLTAEIAARESLAEDVEDLQNRSTITASTYSDAEGMNLELGQIVYITNEEVESGITYGSGAYIKTQDGLKKLDSTTPSTSTTIEERVESLENRAGAIESNIGDTAIEGDSITAAIAALQNDTTHVIEGDDVEE